MAGYMKRTVLLLFLTLTLLFPVFLSGKEKDGKDTRLGLLFYFHTDQAAEIKDYYTVGGKVKLKTEASDKLKFQFEVDINNSEIELDELWGQYDFGAPSLRFGLFENTILMEDSFNRRESVFANKNYLQERLHDMGWSTNDSVGLRLSEKSSKSKLGIDSSSELIYIPDSSGLMLTAGFSYPWAQKDSFLGLSVSYYPQTISGLWDDAPSASVDGFAGDQYIMGTVYFGDSTEKRKLIYKLEAAMGSNLSDPVEYTQYPGDGGCSWFLGANGWLGYIISLNKLDWTPGLNCSFQIHDLSAPEANTTTVKIGNRLNWKDDFYIHADAGVEINNYFEGEDRNIETKPDVLCAIRLQYQY
ncbi:MAG: hypothetical protein PQJ50_12730 [Spirochaetales bacterium]|nr:hypothetical protein [Spirochaetales bacterium]